MNYKRKETLEKLYGPNYSELIKEKLNIKSLDRECKIQYNMYPVLTPQEQFGCPKCFGSGKYDLGRWDEVKECIESHLIPCIWCKETGLLCEYQRQELCSKSYENIGLEKENKVLLEWIKKNSTCTTCHGQTERTPGATNCVECGLFGTQPWGG